MQKKSRITSYPATPKLTPQQDGKPATRENPKNTHERQMERKMNPTNDGTKRHDTNPDGTKKLPPQKHLRKRISSLDTKLRLRDEIVETIPQ